MIPTAVAELLLGLQWPAQLKLNSLLTGGCALHHRHPPELPFRIINTYGPTENTVDSHWAEVDPTGGRPSIGKPIRGVIAKMDLHGDHQFRGRWMTRCKLWK